MKLKPILETGEQIYNYLKEHLEADGMPVTLWPSHAKPQIIIIPATKREVLMAYLDGEDLLEMQISNMGPVSMLKDLFGCTVYFSNYADEIEIF